MRHDSERRRLTTKPRNTGCPELSRDNFSNKRPGEGRAMRWMDNPNQSVVDSRASVSRNTFKQQRVTNQTCSDGIWADGDDAE